jgi:ATP-binding cassette subfamily F protein 3
LEHLLIEYPGTLIIASHDRALLANVSTHTWWATGTSYVFESLPFREGRTQMLKKSLE